MPSTVFSCFAQELSAMTEAEAGIGGGGARNVQIMRGAWLLNVCKHLQMCANIRASMCTESVNVYKCVQNMFQCVQMSTE